MILQTLINKQTSVSTLLEELSIVLEKTEKLSTIKIPARQREIDRLAGMNHRKISTISDDIIDARINHRMGNYDDSQYDALLESKHICEEYRRLCEADFDYWVQKVGGPDPTKLNEKKARQFLKECNLKNGYAWERSMVFSYVALVEDFSKEKDPALRKISKPMKPEDAKRLIIDSYYYKNGKANLTPRQMRLIIQARQAYVTGLVSLLSQMIETNYKLLGLTKEESLKLVNKLENSNDVKRSIQQVENLILKNKKKFIFNNRIDLRGLGFGVMYITSNDLAAVKDTASLNSYLSFLLKYDCVILAHGASVKMSDEEWMKYLDLVEDPYRSSTAKAYEIAHASAYPKKRWMIQPITPDDGTKYVDVNVLMRELIKEGRKNILIVSCNPGHYSLDPDLRLRRDVTITYGTNSVMAENKNYVDLGDKSECVLENVNDKFSDDMEALDGENEENLKILYEDAISMMSPSIQTMDDQYDWGLAKNDIKASNKSITVLLKALVIDAKNMIQEMAKSIHDFFQDAGQKIKASFIVIESAVMKENEVSSQKELINFVNKSNLTIMNEISKVTKNQLQISKDIEKYIDDQVTK